MSFAAQKENSRRTVKNCLPENNIDESRVTDVDINIGKDAYWDFALRETQEAIYIGRSAQMASPMATLEKMLEKLPKQPSGDLIFMDPISSVDVVSLTPFQKRFRENFRCSLRQFVELTASLPVECRFSPAMEEFIDCCRKYSVADCLDALDGNQVRNKRIYRSKLFMINSFYRNLQERLSIPSVRKKICDHAWNIENIFRDAISYVDALFGAYVRLLVIRIDLEYRSDSKAGLDEALSDLERFFKNRRHNKIFYRLRGYIVKVEFGIYTGYHFHVLMFFDGAERKNNADVHIAEKLRDYWNKNITNGKGRAQNINRDKALYEENGCLGIGLIRANDVSGIENLKTIVRYFCKKLQFFRPVNKPNFKCIRKGKPPVWKGKKPGRPRKEGS